MADLSIVEKAHIVSWLISYKSVATVCEMFEQKFNKPAPSHSSMYYWKKKFLETGSIIDDRPRSGRPVTATGDEQTAEIRGLIDSNPTSTREMASVVGISHTSVHNVLMKIGAHPYKPTYSQELVDGDEDRRLQFCESMIDRLNADPTFNRKITFSDECNFHLNGSVNKHNLHYWDTTNPHIRHAVKSGVTRSVTVWASVSARGLIAFEILSGPMNGERYCELLQRKVVPFFTRNRSMIFQQDGAPPHYYRPAREILDKELPGRWIGRRGPTEWPARSPDLTVCDFWLWSELREHVYTPGTNFRSIQELQLKIQTELENLDVTHFQNAFRNWCVRMQKCIDVNGGHFE